MNSHSYIRFWWTWFKIPWNRQIKIGYSFLKKNTWKQALVINVALTMFNGYYGNLTRILASNTFFFLGSTLKVFSLKTKWNTTQKNLFKSQWYLKNVSFWNIDETILLYLNILTMTINSIESKMIYLVNTICKMHTIYVLFSYSLHFFSNIILMRCKM